MSEFENKMKPVMTSVTRLRDDLTQAGHDVWLASLGAVAVLEEEGRTMFDTLVKKGQTYQQTRTGSMPGEKTINRTMDQATEQFKAIGRRMESGLQDTSKAVLHRLGIPTHAEIHALIARVEALTAKVESISRKEAFDDSER